MPYILISNLYLIYFHLKYNRPWPFNIQIVGCQKDLFLIPRHLKVRNFVKKNPYNFIHELVVFLETHCSSKSKVIFLVSLDHWLIKKNLFAKCFFLQNLHPKFLEIFDRRFIKMCRVSASILTIDILKKQLKIKTNQK
jgi:hypothetical protein